MEFIGHRKSGVISIKHSRDKLLLIELSLLEWNNVRFLPVTATYELYQVNQCLVIEDFL